MTFKAFPTQNVTVTYIEVGSPTNNTEAFLDVMAHFYSSFPYLSDAGFASYGSWSVGSPAQLVGNHTMVYTQSLTLLNSTEAHAIEKFAPVLAKVLPHNATADISVNVTHRSFPDWAAFFNTKPDTIAPVDTVGVSASRLLHGPALTAKRSPSWPAPPISRPTTTSTSTAAPSSHTPSGIPTPPRFAPVIMLLAGWI